jgi:hypothetical protein
VIISVNSRYWRGNICFQRNRHLGNLKMALEVGAGRRDRVSGRRVLMCGLIE